MPRHAQAFVVVHLVWATQGRHPILSPALDDALERCVRRASLELQCRPLAVGNAGDHIHVLVQLRASVALSTLVQRLKGRTSRVFRVAWQNGYFAQSIGAADLESVARYVHRQRIHHDDSHPLEQRLDRE